MHHQLKAKKITPKNFTPANKQILKTAKQAKAQIIAFIEKLNKDVVYFLLGNSCQNQ